MAECQYCGRSFTPRIGEQFCSPTHAREFFSRAARSRDSRKSDTKLGLTARHRVMELLRLTGPEPEPPPPAHLTRTEFKPTPVFCPSPSAVPVNLAPLERSAPLALKLPTIELLKVEEGLAALAASIANRTEEVPASPPSPKDDMYALAMPFASDCIASAGRLFAALMGHESLLQPPTIVGRKRSGTTPSKLRRAFAVEFFHQLPLSAGARIAKPQPTPAPWNDGSCLRPKREAAALVSQPGLHFDRIFSLEPFRRTLASPVLPTGQHEQASRSGQHRLSQARWEFRHEMPEDSRRSRQVPSKPLGNGAILNIQRDSVAPWLVPMRPIQPEFRGDLRPFDWAQLIARLADFEDDTVANKTNKHNATTTRMAAVARRKQERLRSIPVLGPMIHFWLTQSWAVRGLALAIPMLAFIAVKPSLDGSLREPVVLAKEMPRPISTVVRREPAKELVAMRGATAPPAVALPNPVAPAPSASKQPHPRLVPERGGTGKATGTLPIANVEPKLDKFDKILLSRAAVELADDFSFGLDSWEARSSAVQWTYDPTGFVRPNGLAIYRPSLNLTDYTVEFLAKIDASAISWVVRAQDLNNYMVVKMVQRGGGPLPRYTIMHYPVVNGREGTRIEHPLPLNLYKDTLFRIRMDIRGANYAVYVQDSVVDSWSDERFPIGGVGFFTGIGEDARIRWVQVTYQNDFVGKLCAWLAPKAQVQ